MGGTRRDRRNKVPKGVTEKNRPIDEMVTYV